MSRPTRLELFRLRAVANDQVQGLPVKEPTCSLVVENALAAPIFVSFSSNDPGPGTYDLVIPGNALRTHPIQGVSAISAKVHYPGAVPAGDDGLFAIFTIVDRDMGATVGPLV